MTLPTFLVGVDTRIAQAAAGDLDPTFGNGGTVTTDITGRSQSFTASERARALVILPDGKIVIAGHSGTGAALNSTSIVLAKYLPSGALDQAFGSGGVVLTDTGANEYAFALALQSDGKLVVAGSNSTNVLLARYLPNGALDASFGAGGLRITTLGHSGRDVAMALQPDGRIVLAGTSAGNLAVERYLPSGALDTAFGTGGRASTDFGGVDSPRAAALQPNGKLVVAGVTVTTTGTPDIVLARYLPNGALDSSFGSGGKVVSDFGVREAAEALAIQPDGKLIVAGSGGLLLARYLPTGTRDNAFGLGGKIINDPSQGWTANAVILQPDGKVVVAGSAPQRPNPVSDFGLQDFLVARYLPGGSLDPTFGAGGGVATPLGSPSSVAYALAMQPDGKLVAAGHGGNTRGIGLARYESAGGVDARPIGGTGLGITPRSSIDLTWTGGEQQLAYQVTRSPTASVTLPDRTATHFSDKSPAYDQNLNCYTLFPLGPNGPLAKSDVLCALLGQRSQTRVPLDFTLRLNESATATLSWTPVGWPNGYLLLAIPLDGSPIRIRELPVATTQMTDATGGVPTCYQLHVYYPTLPIPLEDGRTDVACGVPGLSEFPIAATTARGAADTQQSRAGAPEVKVDRLHQLLQEGRSKVREQADRLRDNERRVTPRPGSGRTR